MCNDTDQHGGWQWLTGWQESVEFLSVPCGASRRQSQRMGSLLQPAGEQVGIHHASLRNAARWGNTSSIMRKRASSFSVVHCAISMPVR